MNILSGVTGKKVGFMDKEGNVTTLDPELIAIMSKVDGFVTIPDRSEVKPDGTIIEHIRTVYDTDPDYVDALSVYLLREGFEVERKKRDANT